MKASLQRGDARPGRDPNGSRWLIARYDRDWSPPNAAPPHRRPVGGARFAGAWYDAFGKAVELAPVRVPGLASWLPLEPVLDREGNAWRSDARGHRIERRAACEESFRALPGFGGHGWRAGELDTPLGLALGGPGWLYVADSGNHRVQVLSPTDAKLVRVLGRVDECGRPLAGDADGALREPVDVAVEPRCARVAVADRAGGRLHLFGPRGEPLASFAALPYGAPRAGHVPRPVAVAWLDDGSLAAVDPELAALLHFDDAGRPLPPIGFDEGPWPQLRAWARFATEGEVILGPLDAGAERTSWHRIALELELPPRCRVAVQSFAADDEAVEIATMPWAPVAPVPLSAAELDAKGRGGRLVRSDRGRWERWRRGPYERAMPELARFEGDGPTHGTSLELPAEALTFVRATDSLELEAGAHVERIAIASVPPTDVTWAARGTARDYGAGTIARLLARGGATLPGEARALCVLAPGETILLNAADTSGRPFRVSVPHALAAFLRPEDELELELAGDRVRLSVEETHLEAREVTLASAVAADFSTSRVRLCDTPGRLLLRDAEGFGPQPPAREPLTVWSAAASQPAKLRLFDERTRALWLEPGGLGPGVDASSWTRVEIQAPRATDQGRFLWLRLSFEGARRRRADEHAIATPRLLSARALYPRPSYLALLPSVYARRDEREDPAGALFLERFLALFEEHLTALETRYEDVSRLLNPAGADEEWLRFLAGWLGLVFDPSWDVERRRRLVLAAPELFRLRGTPAGLLRALEIYLGRAPVLVEGFRWRPSGPLILGRSGRIGCSRLAEPAEGLSARASDLAEHAHRFTLFVEVESGCDLAALESALRRLVDSIEPAHAEYHLHFVPPRARVGLQSTVGLDCVLGGTDTEGIELGAGRDPFDGRVRPLVGFERLRTRSAREAPPAGLSTDGSLVVS